jgi:hypothetical protein
MLNINILYKSISKFLNSNNLELEIRFSYINQIKFNRVFNYLSNLNLEMIEINTKDSFYKNEKNEKVRKTLNLLTLDTTTITKKSLFYKKFDFFEFDLSSEIQVPNENRDIYFSRNKQRFRFFCYQKSIAIDLTIITYIDSKIEIGYEIECEILDNDIFNSLQKLYNIIYSKQFGLLSIILDTKILYKKLPKLILDDNIKITPITLIDLKFLNFKNNTYYISKNYQGIRKLLYFTNGKFWLFFNKDEVSLIGETNLNFFGDFLIDGEITKDDIFYPINLLIYQSKNVENIKFDEKLLFLNNIIKIYNEDYKLNYNLEIKLKKYEKLLNTNELSIYINSNDSNFFYKIKNYTLDLVFNKSSLTTLPFFTSYDNTTNTFVKFLGSNQHTFDIDLNDFLIYNDGDILELSIQNINNKIKLIPISIKKNKKFPNFTHLINNIWNDFN